VEVAEYIDALDREGTLLADSAAVLDPAAPVPTCPGWTLRDLVLHLGGVHRWAGSHIRDRLPSIMQTNLVDIFDRLPSDDELVDWYRGELRLLIDSLREAPADLECATFLKCVSPLHHWARRQAHETTIHRADVESISGSLKPVETAFALDGIDELVDGFVPRRFMKLRSETPVTLRIAPDGTNATWVLSISEEPVAVSHEPVGADCTVTGNPSNIYFALWNRAPRERLTVTGDPAVLDLFADRIRIRWS
jgi:uncharacterized protein (TIGR03083 family)